jgi:hypothetical protein
MAVSVQVTGLDRALATVKNAPRQIRFAAATAVNETALLLQKNTIGKVLPDAFTLRSRGAPWWKPGTRFGFNIRFASRSQPEPFAVLGSRANWLYLQEEGGTKTAGGRSLAIPQMGTARPQAGAVIPSRSKPAKLLRRKRFFVAKVKRGRAIFSRVGKARYPLRFWYAFENEANIDPILHFGMIESLLARNLLPGEFRKALRKALATAK